MKKKCHLFIPALSARGPNILLNLMDGYNRFYLYVIIHKGFPSLWMCKKNVLNFKFQTAIYAVKQIVSSLELVGRSVNRYSVHVCIYFFYSLISLSLIPRQDRVWPISQVDTPKNKPNGWRGAVFVSCFTCFAFWCFQTVITCYWPFPLGALSAFI